MDSLSIQSLTFGHGTTAILNGIDLDLVPGELVVLVGANGAGKTTLLRLLAGLAKPDAGQVGLDGQDVWNLSPVLRSRLIAYLPQFRDLAWPITVRDVVALGRFAFGAGPGRLGPADRQAVEQALMDCDLVTLAERACDRLSGGEQARMHLARALATAAPVLIADEPTASLDPRHAWRVLSLLKDHAADGATVSASLHDLGLAARFADRILVLHEGRLIADGPPDIALCSETLRQAFGIDAELGADKVLLVKSIV